MSVAINMLTRAIVFASVLLFASGCVLDEGEINYYSTEHTLEHIDDITVDGPLDCEQDHFILRTKSLADQRLIITKTAGLPTRSKVTQLEDYVADGDWIEMVSPEIERGDTASFDVIAGESKVILRIVVRRASCIS